jgi:SAM-dependent methyltransferase
MAEPTNGRHGPLSQLVSMLGYIGSLRPYSWSALSQRALRRGVRRLRRLPGGSQLLRVPREDVQPVAFVPACPTVDPAWARKRLESLGVTIERIGIDHSAFEAFLNAARFPSWYYGGQNGTRSTRFLEKTLEHYVGACLLHLSPGDVYLDVGADNSPFSEIAERVFGCRGYQLDAAYRGGARGRYLGCDVSRVPLPDASVDKMAAHCAFDHFQGEADGAFLKEAARLLRPGGRFCVLPLYLSEQHTNFVDPSAWLRPPTLDADAVVVEVPGWGYEFTRYYSPETFLALAARQSEQLFLRAFEVTGVEAIDPGCYLRLAAVFERTDR